MNQMGILQFDERETTVEVNDRMAYLPCPMSAFKVFYEGCEVFPLKEAKSCCSSKSSAGSTEYFKQDYERDISKRSKRVVEIDPDTPTDRNYVYLRDSNSINLNFNADEVTVVYATIRMEYSELLHCNVPVIPYDGKLIEALEWYCLWKMLCRGYTHQVFSLQGNAAVNPYLLWKDARDKARASVINSQQGDGVYKGWASMFYNSTFRPRD